jgi:hypothetical protein
MLGGFLGIDFKFTESLCSHCRKTRRPVTVAALRLRAAQAGRALARASAAGFLGRKPAVGPRAGAAWPASDLARPTLGWGIRVRAVRGPWPTTCLATWADPALGQRPFNGQCRPLADEQQRVVAEVPGGGGILRLCIS